MIFLAVFIGFLAENQREHMVEQQREKQFMVSMINELEADTSRMNTVLQDTAQLKQILIKIDSMVLFRDSLLAELGNPGVFSNSAKAYNYFVRSAHFPDFIYNDRTIQQLKNSGGILIFRRLKKPICILVEKKKQIRLAAAKKTVEKLENS